MPEVIENQAGTSQGEFQPESEQVSTQSTSQGAPRKKDIPGTPENEQSRYDKLVKQVEQREHAWTQKDAEYKQRLEEYNSQLAQLRQEFETIKNPPKPPEVLVEPNEPDYRVFGYQSEEEALNDINYSAAVLKYNKDLAKYNQKLFMQQQEEFKRLNEDYKREQELKERQAQNQRARAEMLSSLQEEGLTVEEANTTLDELLLVMSQPFEQSKKIIADFGRFRKGQPLQPKVPAEKTKFHYPPLGGGAEIENTNPKDFSRSTDYSKLYKTKK